MLVEFFWVFFKCQAPALPRKAIAAKTLISTFFVCAKNHILILKYEIYITFFVINFISIFFQKNAFYAPLEILSHSARVLVWLIDDWSHLFNKKFN